MSPEVIAILASRAPDWWVKDRLDYLRQSERTKARNDKSHTYQERDDLVLIVQAQYEYADMMLKVATKLQKGVKP